MALDGKEMRFEGKNFIIQEFCDANQEKWEILEALDCK
jgi:hypothetical protein